MNNQIKFSFLVLLLLKEFFSIQGIVPSSGHDITKPLGHWIAEIFEDNEDSNINTPIRRALASAEHHRVEQFETNLTHEVENFQSKFIFKDINFYTHSVDAEETQPIELINWKSTNMRVSTKFLRITLEGELRATENESYISYFTTLHFDDFVLNAIRTSNDPNDPKFFFDLSYEDYYVKNHGCCKDIKWISSNLSEDQETELAKEIVPIFPTLLREHINRNPEFSKAFDKIFQTYSRPSDIISEYPDFLNDRQMYYYLLPEIPFFGFHLRNVVVQGLSNIEAFVMSEQSAVFSRRLLIKNIHGSLTLDYGTDHETPLELNYFVDFLSVSINEERDYVHVEARSFSVNHTNGDSLSYRQSANVMQKIESGLASALMPSKKAWKAIDMESEIGPINLADKSEWKTIRQSYNTWIPFNNDHTQVHILPQISWVKIILGGGRWMMNG